MKIYFKVIIPNEDLFYQDYENIVIKEPNYDKILSEYEYNNGYKMNDNFSECLGICELGKICIDYNYYNEIINYSNMLFVENNNSFLDYLEDIGIIEYLYDIKNMNKSKFRYYDIQKKLYGFVVLKGKKYYRNNKKTKGMNLPDASIGVSKISP
jgi:hypothetical protein